MFTKIYWGLWTVLAAITVLLFATGGLGWLAITVIGFVASLMAFVGMICVTPTIVGPHATEFDHPDSEPAPQQRQVKATKRFATSGVGVQSRHA